MSLTKVVQDGVDTAFKVLGDLVKSGAWIKQPAGAVPDFAAGTPAAAAEDIHPIKRYIFTRFKQEEVDGKDVTSKDQKVIFPRQDLDIEPDDADRFRDVLGRTWEVKRIMSDPAAAVVVAQVRRS